MDTQKRSFLSAGKRKLAWVSVLILLTMAACVRNLTPPDNSQAELSSDQIAQTRDAGIQLTLDALLSSATAEIEQAPQATATPEPEEATATPTADAAQLTELAAAGEATDTPEATATASGTPEPTAAPCYAHRYVYDETIPDGTRMDPGEQFQKTWRLQNVGSCDWVGGQYELAFVSGERMGGQNPLTITFTVPVDGYANFSINLTAPGTPGTYRGYWILRTSNGDDIGWGPNADQPFWVEIVVRGPTPSP